MGQPLPTNIPDVVELDLDDMELQDLAPEVELILKGLDKPRANLGNSGPPGRVD